MLSEKLEHYWKAFSQRFTIFSHRLALVVGSKAGIVLKLIDDWCEFNRQKGLGYRSADGQWWVQIGARQIASTCPFLGVTRTIQRLLTSLTAEGVLCKLSSCEVPIGGVANYYRVNRNLLDKALEQLSCNPVFQEALESSREVANQAYAAIDNCFQPRAQKKEAVPGEALVTTAPLPPSPTPTTPSPTPATPSPTSQGDRRNTFSRIKQLIAEQAGTNPYPVSDGLIDSQSMLRKEYQMFFDSRLAGLSLTTLLRGDVSRYVMCVFSEIGYDILDLPTMVLEFYRDYALRLTARACQPGMPYEKMPATDTAAKNSLSRKFYEEKETLFLRGELEQYVERMESHKKSQSQRESSRAQSAKAAEPSMDKTIAEAKLAIKNGGLGIPVINHDPITAKPLERNLLKVLRGPVKPEVRKQEGDRWVEWYNRKIKGNLPAPLPFDISLLHDAYIELLSPEQKSNIANSIT